MGLLIIGILILVTLGGAEPYVVESGYDNLEVVPVPGEPIEVPFYSLPLNVILIFGIAIVCPDLLPLIDLLFGLGLLSAFGIRRLTRGNVLEHEGRVAIYECIRAKPGVRFTGILAMTGLNRGTAEYHLHVLEWTGKIRHLDTAGYIDASHPAVAEVEIKLKLRAAAGSGAAEKILKHVARRDEIDRTALAGELALSGPLLSYHLGRLIDAGLVISEHRGRTVRYSMPASVRERLGESMDQPGAAMTGPDLRLARPGESVSMVE